MTKIFSPPWWEIIITFIHENSILYVTVHVELMSVQPYSRKQNSGVNPGSSLQATLWGASSNALYILYSVLIQFQRSHWNLLIKSTAESVHFLLKKIATTLLCLLLLGHKLNDKEHYWNIKPFVVIIALQLLNL